MTLAPFAFPFFFPVSSPLPSSSGYFIRDEYKREECGLVFFFFFFFFFEFIENPFPPLFLFPLGEGEIGGRERRGGRRDIVIKILFIEFVARRGLIIIPRNEG